MQCVSVSNLRESGKADLTDLEAIDSMIAITADIFQDPAVTFDAI